MKPWPTVRLGAVLARSKQIFGEMANAEYREITVRLWGKGVVERGRVTGASLSGRRSVAHRGQVSSAKLTGWEAKLLLFSR